jgi:hypothetical protein
MALATTASGADLPLREHVLRTLRLAGPVMLARAGLLVMVSVDTIMCGRVAARELAFYGIALAPHLAFLLVGIGLLMGTVVITAQTDGAGRPAECGRIWRLGLVDAAACGSLFALLLLPGEAILLALGQAPEISRGGGAVLVMFALGMPPILMFSATTFFLEGIGRSTPGMVVMAIANVVNFGLNYALMFEPWQLGATGAALATSITRWVMFLALAGYVLAMRERDRYGVRAKMTGHWHLQRKLARLGWPGERRVFRRRHVRRLARRRAARGLSDHPQRDGTDLHVGDRPRDGDRRPGRQRGWPARLGGARQGRLGRSRSGHRGHALPDAAAVRLERRDRPDLHRRRGGRGDRCTGTGACRLDPAGRRQPGHHDRGAAGRS